MHIGKRSARRIIYMRIQKLNGPYGEYDIIGMFLFFARKHGKDVSLYQKKPCAEETPGLT
jgi:hypothetical protein